GTTQLGTALTNTTGAWTYTTLALTVGTHSFTATAIDQAGNIGAPSLPFSQTINPAPMVTAITETPSSGDLNAGKVVTLTLTMSSSVLVTGIPTLLLNDGATATYVSGSGSNTLNFSYTVAAGQTTPALAIISINLPTGASIKDSTGNSAILSLTGLTQTGPMIDAVAPNSPIILSDSVSGNAVTLNGKAEANSIVAIFEGSTKLATGVADSSGNFSVTTGVLSVGTHSFTASATDQAGNTGPLTPLPFTQIIFAVPMLTSITETPSSGDLNAGHTVTLTLKMSSAVTVTGAPTLTLNDNGIASYVSGSGTNTLSFSYTVASGETATALAITAINLNGGTIKDSVGNTALLSLTGLTQTGPMIDTSAPNMPIILGDSVKANAVTLNGTAEPNSTISIMDGSALLGTTSTNSTGTWTFTTSVLLAGSHSFTAVATDHAGNLSTPSLAFTQSLTPLSTLLSITDTPSSGDFNAGKIVTLTLTMSAAVTVSAVGGAGPTLLLNDGGIATYTGGSGTNSLSFSYVVAA
ncbi:MAG TPA: Ig-like domain-containing protein, partial [Candidatus Saccharimonadales bacterium]|nr:Ig-like domain-containing protein [Candidatus Saccharimonadales bacterium]